MLRVLVTGAGGPSAVSFMRSIDGDDVELYAGDMDPYAAGLYLVPEDRRVILRPGAHPAFVDEAIAYCAHNRIDVFVPTVDWELESVANARDRFGACGTRVMVAEPETLALALDKWTLLQVCEGVCAVPQTALFDDTFDAESAASSWCLPLLVKPRRGAGSRGVRVAQTLAELERIPRDGSLIVQEFLPGEEYSVDVLSALDAAVIAVVPRLRLKIDSGIAVAGRTLHDEGLDAVSRAVANRLRLTFVSNIQFRRDAHGVARLLEVNVRVPGTMPLTIASGIDMPRLALDLLLGRPLPADVAEFRELAMVRTWQEHFAEADAFARVAYRTAGLLS
jgi:carbamoyl-phosphate synthase large subunit